ncbi:MAG: bacteriophage adsorption protein [Ramlibacter sp.]|nr:bacteriophage adsorption protein [Ramlibacter sp.]
MKQEQRKALALAAALALSSFHAAAQTGPRGAAAARGAHQAAQTANSAADAGYKAYARRDYAAAVANAQRAVQLAPARRDYWLLLAQAQAGNGQPEQAEQSLVRAAQVSGDDGALARARTDLGRQRAQVAGDAMYKALQAGDVKAAIAAGTDAVRFAPENAGFRLVLVHALLRDGRFADADRVANETIALLPDSAAPLALRGYARQGLNRSADAAADLDRALQQRGVQPASQRQLRLLAADLALAQGNGARAVELLQALPADDADAAGRREIARQALAAPGSPTTFALRAPGIDCSNVDASQTCTLQAAAVPALPGFANATAAYRALEERDVQRALAQARLATAAAPGQRDWQLMHMNAALAAGENAEAERAASAALALSSDAPLLAQRSSIRRGLGNTAGANADAEAALAAGGLPVTTEAALLADLGRTREARNRLATAPADAGTPQNRLDAAYLSTRIGDTEAARQSFAAADAGGGLPATSLLDAGYAAMHSKHDDEALQYFKRAIDAANGLQLKMEPQMLYDTRRTVADLTRKWGVLASVTLRNGAGIAPGFGNINGSGSGRVTQAGVEGYYRPWGYRNGEFVELFARGFMTLNDQNNGLTGGESFQGGVGVRWKPISAQNLVLSFSRVFGPNVNDDWLAQVGYSWDTGNDLRVDGTPSWWTARFYAEVGRYLDAGNNYGIASLMAGRSYLLGGDGRTVLFPHAFVGVEYSSNDPSAKTSAGIGPGVSVRRWFRDDVYNAPRSYWDLTLQYRARLSGDDRMKGLFVNGLLSY